MAWFADGTSHWIRHKRYDYCRNYVREFKAAGYNVVFGFPELSGNPFWGLLAPFLNLVEVKGVWQTPEVSAKKKKDVDTPPPAPQRIPSSLLLRLAGGGNTLPPNFAGVSMRSLPTAVTSALSGESLVISPWDQHDYYEEYESYLRMLAEEGMKFFHSMSDGTGPFEPQHVRNEHMRRIAEIHQRVGYEHIFGVTINEPLNIGFDYEDAVETMNAYRHHTGGQVITFGGAPCSEVASEIARLARGATGWEEHTARGPSFETQAHHPWSLLREQRLHEEIAWLGALTEGTGPGDPVSVGQQNHPEAVVMIRAIEAACHSACFAFCGKGLFSRWHGDTFHNVPGWTQIPKVIAILEDFTRKKLHTFRKLTHTGAGDRFMTARDWRDGMRFVQYGSEEDKLAIGLLFGEHMGTPLDSNKGGQLRVLHPTTVDVTPINSGDYVDFDRGRIILLEW